MSVGDEIQAMSAMMQEWLEVWLYKIKRIGAGTANNGNGGWQKAFSVLVKCFQ